MYDNNIRYSICGHQIVNLYDAAGHKYKSIIYTNIASAGTQYDDVAHYEFDMDTVAWRITEYNNNVELVYTREDTITRRIHNSIGYNADGIYYHYIKDHLGNICAVVNSETNTPVQRTTYYASGVPMAENLGPDVPPSLYHAMGVQYTENFGRDEQPYLYNGKEFVEAHGWNTYDYGFRGYYTPIGRFTSLDPLAEQTPWQSSYAYAGNNFINSIDWMGLAIWNINEGNQSEWDQIIKSLRGNNILHYTELDDDGTVKEHINNGDNSVVYNGDIIGTEMENERYEKGRRVYIRRTIGGYVKYFDVKGGWYIGLYDEWEDKVSKWMRWKGIGKHEKEILDATEPIALNVVLCIPIVSQINDAMVLIKGENLYGYQADDLDQKLAIVSLITFGAEKFIPMQEVKHGAKHLNRGSSVLSTTHSLQKEYEHTSQTHY